MSKWTPGCVEAGQRKSAIDSRTAEQSERRYESLASSPLAPPSHPRCPPHDSGQWAREVELNESEMDTPHRRRGAFIARRRILALPVCPTRRLAVGSNGRGRTDRSSRTRQTLPIPARGGGGGGEAEKTPPPPPPAGKKHRRITNRLDDTRW